MFFLIPVILLCCSTWLSSMCPSLTVGGNIWQLTGQIYCTTSKIDSEIATLSASSIDIISSQVQELVTNLDAANSVIELLVSDANTILTQLENVESITATICSCIDAATQPLSILDVVIATKVDSVGSQISQVKSDLDSCCNTLSVLDVVIATKVDSVGSQVSQVKSDLDTSVSILSTLDVVIATKVDSVGSQVSQVKSDLDACCSTLSALDVVIATKVDSVGSQVSQVKSDLDTSVSSLSTLDVVIATKVDSVGSQVSQVKSDLDSCCSTLSALDVGIGTKVDSVGSQVSQVKSDLDASFTTLDTALLGTIITQAQIPYTIGASGKYTVSGTLSYSGGGPAITISASNVLLDLGGNTLNTSASSIGIAAASVNNIEIRNGSIAPSAQTLFIVGCNDVYIHDINVYQPANIGFELSGNSITVNNCRFYGNNGNIVGGTTYPAHITITGSTSDVVINNCQSYNPSASSYSVLIATDGTLIKFSNCLSDTAGSDAFVASGVGQSVIIMENCTAQNANNFTSTGFRIDTDASGTAHEIILQGCIATDCHAGFSSLNAVGTSSGLFSQVVCNNCLAVNNVFAGFDLESVARGYALNNCISVYNTDHGVYCTGQAINIDNSIADHNGMTGFNLLPQQQSTVRACESNNNTQNGFTLGAVAGGFVLKDSLTSYNGGIGINITATSATSAVLDTRSFGNGSPDVVGAATVITY